MSIRNFVPTIWTGKVHSEMEKLLVFKGLVNTDYEGEIKDYGDTVKINSISEVTVTNYVPNVTQVTPQLLDGQQTVLLIDQARAWSFYIDDVDHAQTKPKLMGKAMGNAAYALADDLDQHLAGLHEFAGTQLLSTDISIAAAHHVLSRIARALDEKNIPRTGRWAVLPPWFHQKLSINHIYQTAGSVSADKTYRTGYIGDAFGFSLYMSNNLSTGTGAAGAGGGPHYAMAGTNQAISMANQVVQTEAYRPERQFGDAMKGLHVYGAKTVVPRALVRVTLASSS